MEDFYALRIKTLWSHFRGESFAFWMTCGYLLFEYLRPQSIFPVIDFAPWSFLFLVGAMVGWLADGKSKWVSATPTKWMIYFYVILIVSVLTAMYPDVSKKYFKDVFSWLIVYFVIILNTTSRKRFFILLLIFLFTSFKISFSLARIWAMRGFAFTSWGLQGPPGFFTNSGELSIQMLVYAPVAYHLYLVIKPHLSRNKKIMMLLMPVTAAMTVIGASSRGSQIGLVYQIYALFLRGRLSFKSILITVSVVGLVYYFIPAEQKERFQNTGKDRTSEQRLLYWKHGREMIEEHPALGVGFFNFIPYYEQHFRADMLYSHAELPHNIFIQVGTDAGFLGLLGYVMLILQVFLLNRRTRKRAVGLEGEFFFVSISKGIDIGTIGFLIAGQFVTVGYYPFLWMNLAFSTSLNYICMQEARLVQENGMGRYPGVSHRG